MYDDLVKGNPDFKVIIKAVSKVASRFPYWDFDELLSEATLAYISAIPKYDPEKGAKSTFIWRVVTNQLYTYLGACKRDKEKEVNTLHDEEDDFDPGVSPNRFWAELSVDARDLALVTLYVADKVARLVRSRITKEVRSIMISDYGWDETRFELAVAELRDALI